MIRVGWGYVNRPYTGIIREEGYPTWICSHSHVSRDDAKECAQQELLRRKAAKS